MARKKHFGFCIYCGRSDCFLTDEHAIPDAISGDIVLQKACCTKCQKIINRFEQRYLRKTLGLSRALWNLPRSRKKKRPSVKPIISGRELKPSDVMVQYLTVLPRHKPWIEHGKIQTIEGSMDQIIMASPTSWKLPQPDNPPTFRVDDAYRFITKVAYGLTMFNYALSFRESPVTKYILTGDGNFRAFLGGSRIKTDAGKLHTWSYQKIQTTNFGICPNRVFLEIKLTLFSKISDATFHVVTRDITDEMDHIRSHEQA